MYNNKYINKIGVLQPYIIREKLFYKFLSFVVLQKKFTFHSNTVKC